MQVGAVGAAGVPGSVTILPPMPRAAMAGTASVVRRAAARPSALARAGWFAWLPVWLSAGIGLWFALRFQPGTPHYAIAGAVAAAGLLLWFAGPRWGERGWLPWRLIDAMRLGGLALAVAAAGFGLTGLRAAAVEAPVLGWRYVGPVEGRVVEVDRSSRDRIRVTLDQVRMGRISAARTPERVRLSLTGAEGTQIAPAPGTLVSMIGNLSAPPGPSAPGGFDFRRQAWFERLGAIGFSRAPIAVLAEAEPGGGLWLARLRLRLSAAMQAGIGGQEGAVASALMTGDRSTIAEATNAVMRDANLYHIVSISGLHMSMLAGFIYAALRIALSALAAATGRGLALPVHKLAAVVALAAAAFYMALSDGGVATERAFVMVAVMLGAIVVDRRAISLRTVALAALILLAISPEALTQAGFQMSFAATVALILAIEPWTRVAPRLPRLLRPVAMLVVSSLVAGLATAPLAAAHFGRMSEFGLLANLLAVPVMGAVVMPAGVIAALLAPVGLAQPALWVMGLGTGWMLDVARFVASLDGAVTMVKAPPPLMLPLLGVGGVLLALGGGGTILPRHAIRGAGAGLVALALGLWITTARPAVLIAPEGDAVGLRAPSLHAPSLHAPSLHAPSLHATGADGRALSRARGGAFAVASWLEDDGDAATPKEAATRPGWDGPTGARRAMMPDGRALIHLTGRGAGEAVAPACTGNAVVVVAAELTAPPPAGCLLIDRTSLRRSGALAFDGRGRMTSVRDLSGQRPWAPKPWERRRNRTGEGGDTKAAPAAMPASPRTGAPTQTRARSKVEAAVGMGD